ncbi:MAG: C4-dicarboxylate ABC transporter [Actinobacteria bacterium]|nr:MAG: C4-dicarboxylate ABC transporter [Actinomycetota bacterium]RIK02542.1 MAG: C4-dicarboxylate ABC transporter [Acidobacteriota bacterium]
MAAQVDQPESEFPPPRDELGAPVLTHLKARLALMHPAYFALVMATGIVAISCHLFELNYLALALSAINLVAYPTLCALFIARAVVFPDRVAADWRDHGRAPGYFTVVAATGVLGVQVALLYDAILVAQVLWWVCVALWAACTYTIFTLLTVGDNKPSLAEGINGGWLVSVVATQAVSVLGLTMNGAVLGDSDVALFTMMVFWLGGGMLYLWIIGLIFYRYMFFRFSPRDFMAPYWINMGAVAISALAGSLLASAAEDSAMLAPLRPFILGLSVMFWATATWWIPMLVVLGIWRHGVRGVPISYDPLYWGLVFPIGMYSVCTFRLSEALGAAFLLWVARVFVVAAVAAWLLTFLGLAQRMLYAVLLTFRRPQTTLEPLPHAALEPVSDPTTVGVSATGGSQQ